MTKRTKAKRIEAWWCAKCSGAVAVCGGGLSGCAGPHCEECGGMKVVHLVEADPLARLKEDVVAECLRWLRLNPEDFYASTTLALKAAAERLERKR